MISSLYVRIPKYEIPILAEMKKTIFTDIIDMNINSQDIGSNSLKRFQVGGTLSGKLENQYSGR